VIFILIKIYNKEILIIRKGKFFTFHTAAIAKVHTFSSEFYFILINEKGKKVMFLDDEIISLVR